jgi:hypothetical protein
MLKIRPTIYQTSGYGICDVSISAQVPSYKLDWNKLFSFNAVGLPQGASGDGHVSHSLRLSENLISRTAARVSKKIPVNLMQSVAIKSSYFSFPRKVNSNGLMNLCNGSNAKCGNHGNHKDNINHRISDNVNNPTL